MRDVRKHDIGKYTNRLVNFLEGAAISIGKLLFSVIVVFVVSIYMLLDFPKLERRIDRRFPPEPGSVPLVRRVEQSLTSYVKGQSLVSLIIGTSAGVGLWLFGVLGWLPHGEKYALLFGAWVAITELIPYSGTLARCDSAVSVRARRPSRFGDLGFFAVPGDPSGRRSHRRPESDGECTAAPSAARHLRPARRRRDLGLPGALMALPLLAAGRAMWEFFAERVEMEPWERERCRRSMRASRRPRGGLLRVSGPGGGGSGNREVPPADSQRVVNEAVLCGRRSKGRA